MGFGRNRFDQHQGPPLGGRRKRGAFAQAIGTSRGGRTSKLHGLTDGAGRPRVLLISPGNISDMTMAPALIEAGAGHFDRLIADKGYDSNAIRAAVQAQGAEVVIPPNRTRKVLIPYDRDAYQTRNLVERRLVSKTQPIPSGKGRVGKATQVAQFRRMPLGRTAPDVIEK